MSTLKTNNIQHVDRSDPSIIINTDGSVNIAGTMTYEDVTNVDAVGIITGRSNIDAQKQVHVGTGVSIKSGGINVTAGVSTFVDASVRHVTGVGATFSLIRIGKTGGQGKGLEIYQASDAALRIQNSTTGTGTNDGILFEANQSDALLLNYESGHMRFGTAGTERMRITSAGKVGINTNNPLGDMLTVCEFNSGTNIYDNIALRLQGSSGQNVALQFTDTTGAAAYIAVQGDALRLGTNNAERLRIDSNGMIGIGGVTPKTQNTFDAIEFGKTGFLGSQTAARTVEIVSNAYYNSGWKYKENDVASQYYQYQGYHAFTNATSGSADGAISFTERMRIDADGRLLIAATSGTARLHIKGSGGDGIKIENSGGTNAATIDLKNTLSSYEQEYRLAVAGSDGAYGTAKALFVRDQTAGANRFEVQAGGDVRVSTGNLLIGTAGKGVNFSAYATGGNPSSNLLDDYEEGIATFTLFINGSAWSGATYSYNTAPYVKVGRMVYCGVSMFANNLDGTTGVVAISGLPFQDGGGGGYREPAFLAANHSLGTNPSVIFGALAGSSTTIALRKAGSADLNGSDLGSSFWMHGSIVYMST